MCAYSVSTHKTTTILGKTLYTETLTLNTESYGNGDYIYYPVHQHIQEEINISF
jgi:hypothetical protein